MSIKITFPDGAVREYDKGITALDIANKLSNSLGKKILSAKINNKVCDATLPINDDATLELLTWNENDGKQTFGTHQHTCWQRL